MHAVVGGRRVAVVEAGEGSRAASRRSAQGVGVELSRALLLLLASRRSSVALDPTGRRRSQEVVRGGGVGDVTAASA